MKKIVKIASLHPVYKSWKQIEDEQDPDGINHDLKLSCVKCNNQQTCRCSKPKKSFLGICPRCMGE
jgi:hypothetical protein